MLGAEHLLADSQRIAKKRLGLRVSRAPMEIAAHPVQKVRPVCSLQSLIRGRFVSRKQMWREMGAQRPGLRIAVSLLWIGRRQPCNQSPDGILRRTICLRTLSCHGLNETMHCYRRSAILKGVMLQERNFGKCGERFHALHFILNRSLDQYDWDTLRRTLGQIRHECIRRLTLRYGLGDGE